jgi:cell fate regulator YaaT (PSP1 superfamily)
MAKAKREERKAMSEVDRQKAKMAEYEVKYKTHYAPLFAYYEADHRVAQRNLPKELRG